MGIENTAPSGHSALKFKEKTDMITDIKKIEGVALYQAQILIHGQQVIAGILPGDWLKTVCQANKDVKGFEIRAVELGVD